MVAGDFAKILLRLDAFAVGSMPRLPNAHKPPKPVAPKMFMLGKKL